MKASVFYEHGGSDKLKYVEIDKPDSDNNNVLVKVHATALNHLDIFVRNGIPGLNLPLPHILGSDIVGEVSEMGSKVSKDIVVGDKVVIDPSLSCGYCEFCIKGEESLCREYKIVGEHVFGGYAEFFSISEQNIVKVPNDIPIEFTDLAALPLTSLTAWRMIVTKAKIRPGDVVLITGIGGGVALAGLQLAKIAGAKKIIVTSSDDEKLKKAIDLGADEGINYINNPDFHKEIWKLTNKRGVDIVFDSSGQKTFNNSLRSLRKNGKYVTCGATTGPKASINLNSLFWNQFEILGSTMGSRSELRDVLKLVYSGKLKPVIHKRLPLSEAAKAHDILESGKQFGKILLIP